MDHGLLLNQNWRFKLLRENESFIGGEETGFEMVSLPHTIQQLPLNCFSHQEIQKRCVYTKKILVSPEQSTKRALLVFDGVMASMVVMMNGNEIGRHKGGYSRAIIEATGMLRVGENTLTVRVDSHEDPDIPPFGYVIDYLTYGGIYRDVTLYYQEELFIRDMLVRYDLCGEQALLYPELFLDNGGRAQTVTFQVDVKNADGNLVASYQESVFVEPGVQRLILKKHIVENLQRWSPEAPALYSVSCAVQKNPGAVLDTAFCRHVGFREVRVDVDGVWINGEHCKLVGLNRHQAFPYVGYAMGRRAQRRDAEILHEFFLNAVRTSHYMQSKYFLERCDELGMLVLSEIPGWGHLGGEAFQAQVLKDVEDMVTTQFNHPSVFLWGVRVNESLDNDALYEKTNALAHSLDPSRMTTGVRYLRHSHLLEDVYCINDFTHAGKEQLMESQRQVTGLDRDVPMIVSECMGANFPVKSFDNESIREEHAIRYARLLSLSSQRKDSAGLFGWCAFDYNTHGDYGSGDKICYHGVFDMFRMPKYAAFLFQSQRPTAQGIVMEPTTQFVRGDRFDNRHLPFFICTNCDYVEVEMYGKNVGRYYPSLKFHGLAHPPIEVTPAEGAWQDMWQDAVITGYYQGRAVARRVYPRDAYLADVLINADDQILYSDEIDETRFACAFVDQCGNRLPYYNGVLRIETEGDIELIGPSVVAAMGNIAFWVHTTGASGEKTACVRVSPLNTSIAPKTFQLRLTAQH